MLIGLPMEASLIGRIFYTQATSVSGLAQAASREFIIK